VRRITALLVVLLVPQSNSARAQQPLSEEEKKRLFLKAREEMTTIPYTPPPTPGAAPKPKPQTPASPTAPSPKPVPARPAPPLRPPDEPAAPIVVTREGVVEPDQEEPAPQKEDGFWNRVFGGSTSYKYLTPSVRRAIDRASIKRGRWRYIVVHNSGTRQGNAAAFEHYHRYVRRMPNGLAYHFVIGNGTSSKNGQIEIGSRWHRQVQGGHVHSDYLNNIALGICFVGDFNHGKPTSVQLEAASELVDYLRRKVGRVGGQRAVVRPHKAVNPPRWATDCPGDDFPYAWFRKF
jgi:N-acetylmuramoyl-L-alanine amidase